MDLTGSGVETHAHLHEPGNGRIVVMFIAFTGPPKIVRLWGRGTPLENGTPEFDAFVEQHKVPLKPGSRSIITIDIDQCATSCGFSVPYYDFVSHRPILDDFFVKKAAKHAAGDEKESMDRYVPLLPTTSLPFPPPSPYFCFIYSRTSVCYRE
jgi:hypothetical protein